MRTREILVMILFSMFITPLVYAQDDVTPTSLEVKVYPDGSTLVTYVVESDPTKVRVDVELFSNNYNNLIIRDEDGIPLGSTIIEGGLTVDSIGASELVIVYTTSDLTTKDGPIWNLNLSSPVSTLVILPQGAAIFDLGDIPTDLGNINGAQYLEMPAGEIYVSFILSMPNLIGDAQTAINEAETYIASLESQDYVLIEAHSELTQAKQLIDTDQYIEAKSMAYQAIDTADDIVETANSAAVEIALAESSVTGAEEDGRTEGLPQAIDTLNSAKSYYSEGSYLEAETAAKQASHLALLTDEPSSGNTLLYLGVAILISAAGGGYYLMKKMRQEEPTPSQPEVKVPDFQEKTVDLEKIFVINEDLRLEDREVIKFLAENNGEAFATEIRDRFDMPRSSTWRLIRRLKSLEIVEEVKVGNQSLVKIIKRYIN
jgi:uncharacterized membrane protein